MALEKPCGDCGTVLTKDDQVRSGGRVQCLPCARAEKLANAQSTDQCSKCLEPIGAHREHNEHGAVLCADCGTGVSAQGSRSSTAPATTQRRGSATAEEEVAAELEKLIGPARSTAAAPAAAPIAAHEQHVTEAELVSALDEIASRRQPAARAKAPVPNAAAPAKTRLTEEDVAAELEKLMGATSAA
ncbi:MAG: hypothetical protein ABUL60_32930 [Myxococcales bacterium]